MRTYLFLAGFWMLAAAFVFTSPTFQHYHILDTDWSIGWVLLLFGGWHLLRWWTTRPTAKTKSEPDSKSP